MVGKFDGRDAHPIAGHEISAGDEVFVSIPGFYGENVGEWARVVSTSHKEDPQNLAVVYKNGRDQPGRVYSVHPGNVSHIRPWREF